MIVLSCSNAQVIPAGQSATFDIVVLHTGCAECYYPNSGSVTLTRSNAIYDFDFNANIGATEAGDAQLAITLNGSPLAETTSIVVTAAAGDLQNVKAGTSRKTCCCGNPGFIMLTNTGTTDINMGANPMLRIRRVA